MKRYGLQFKYGVSRGRDTYGYNIVSLWVNGVKASSVNGGGYDMQGAALGNWVTKQFQSELLAIAARAHRVVMVDENGKWAGKQEHRDGNYLYGMTSARIEGSGQFRSVSIDGACGIESVRKILNAIGYEYSRVTGDVYVVETVAA